MIDLPESTALHQRIEILRHVLSREAVDREGLQEFASQPPLRPRVHLQTSEEASSGRAQRCPIVEQLALQDFVCVCSRFVIFWLHMLFLFLFCFVCSFALEFAPPPPAHTRTTLPTRPTLVRHIVHMLCL